MTIYLALIGITGAGKSTLCNAMRDNPAFGLIEVGKEMTKRHPPEYFNGKGAMEETEAEAWEIFDEQFIKANKRAVVIIDGMPRMPHQVEQLYCRTRELSMLWLHASDEIIRMRTERRVKDAMELDLRMRRIKNDRLQLYDTIHKYLSVFAGSNHFAGYDTGINGAFGTSWTKDVIHSIIGED